MPDATFEETALVRADETPSALTMLGGMLNVGDHLMGAHPVLGWVFYGLLAVLVVVGVVVPLFKVAQRPIFSLYQLRDEQGHAKRRWCRMLVDNLIANTDVTDEEIVQLEGYLQKGDEADDLLIEFFTKKCVPAIDAETKRAASTAFFVSAISALIIGGIEDSDLSDLIGQLMGGGAGARAGGIVIGATAEGLVSAFLVFRVGVIAKRWLTAADGPERMSSIRRTSYREALALMRSSEFMQVVTDTVKQTSTAVATSVANSMGNAARSTVESAKSAFSSIWHHADS